MAAGIAVVLFVVLCSLAQTVVAAVTSGPSVAQPMQTISATHPVAGPEYWTVRPGDTLWTIAQAVTPKGDIRPVLKRLDERYGSSPLVAGQNILVS
jgi:hypothetical protein